MKPIEEYIRKKLGATPPPPDLDAEDLWAGIAAGLPVEGKKRPVGGSTPRSDWWRFLPLLLVAIMIIGGSIAWWLTQATEGNEEVLAAKNYSTTTIDVPGNQQEASTDLAVTTTQELPVQVDDQHLNSQAVQGAPLTSNEVEKNGVSANKDAIVAKPVAKNNTSTQVVDSNLLEGITTPLKEDAAQRAANVDLKQSMAITQVSGPAAIDQLDYTRPLPDQPVTDQFRPVLRQRLSAGIHLGSNILLRKYASTGDDSGQQLNQATGQMIGQTAAIDFRYRLNDNLTMGVGLDYHRTGNTFQYVSEWDTLIPHPTPPNTGLIDAVARRSVAHNNQEERLSIPLLLAYERQFGELTAGIGVGAGLNWQTNVSGRTLTSNGRIITYDAPLQRSFFLSWQVQPWLSWQPDPEKPWAIQLRLDATRFRLQQSAVTGTQQQGWLFGAALGVRYRLGR